MRFCCRLFNWSLIATHVLVWVWFFFFVGLFVCLFFLLSLLIIVFLFFPSFGKFL